MPVGTINKDLTPGTIFENDYAHLYCYMGYYRNNESGTNSYLYAGLLFIPNTKNKTVATDQELIDFEHPTDKRGGVNYSTHKGLIRFTKRPIAFSRVEHVITPSAMTQVINNVPGFTRLGDRK